MKLRYLKKHQDKIMEENTEDYRHQKKKNIPEAELLIIDEFLGKLVFISEANS